MPLLPRALGRRQREDRALLAIAWRYLLILTAPLVAGGSLLYGLMHAGLGRFQGIPNMGRRMAATSPR